MTKCLLKALKAVNLENHVDLFRSLGYDSAGALAHFQKEHFKRLNFSSDEILRVHALLDVLKEATREGKICPHYCKSTTHQTTVRARSTEPPIHQRNSHLIKTNTFHSTRPSNENLKSKRSASAVGATGRRLTSLSTTNKTHANGFILQRPSSGVIQQSKYQDQQFFGPKSLVNRPAVQHVKIKSYNYGVPTTKQQQQQQRNPTQRVRYQHEPNFNHPSVFVSSSHQSTDTVSYAKPAEIYVYARKRPLLSSETNFRDVITVPDNKHMVMLETKSNLDSTPLLKKSEFQFDQVFPSDASNKQVFESTVLPFLSTNYRHNLTYICFGQTGSGKSHTIFGSRNTDGLLIYCTQFLLQEVKYQNKLLCSFYEIYNNQVYDLTDTGKRLFVREDGDQHVNIVGLSEIVLKSLDTLRSIIYDGLARRHHGKSAFNSNSSRSHAIFQIILKNTSNPNDYFRMVFIDLAGSERATDAQNNQKQTRREGAQINSSLLALKECIRSMDMIHAHAPFRQSKLTHILRDSLVGSQTRTCLMANVSPASDCCQCSLNTLQYASRIRDISIRHRHRSMSMNNLQRNYVDDEQQEIVEPTTRGKPQRTFKPSTASTPVQRRMAAVDHRTYMATNQTGINTRKPTTASSIKASETDWRIPDNDLPISGSGDNARLKSVLSSTREFLLNNNTNNANNQSSSFYLTRYEQPRKKNLTQEENASSYFPQPQADIKRTSPLPQPDPQLLQPWISVTAHSTRRQSDSSTEPSTSARVIPIHMSDDNQYSSATGTESLGTKITKLATGTNPQPRSNGVENLNLNKQYDTVTTTTATTTDAEQGLYTDRQATHRDQTGFFSNREEDPLYEQPHLKPTNLTTITQRTSPTTTPKNTSLQFRSDALSTSSKQTFSSPNKTHHRNRHLEPSSSSSSLTSVNSNQNHRYSSPKPSRHQHRIVPYQNSDSDEVKYHPQKTSSIRHESSQTIEEIPIRKNEQEQTEDQFLLDQFSDDSSNNYLQAPLDQIKHFYDRTASSLSPSKDYGVRASDQLNTLRSLLETRLREQDDLNHRPFKSSPGTFTKEFLHSYKSKNLSKELISDLDDEDHELTRMTTNKYQSDALSSSSTLTINRNESTLTNEIGRDKLHHSSPTSLIRSTYTPNNDTRESRFLSTSLTGIYPRKASISNSDIIESTTDSEHISDANSGSQNAYTGGSSNGSSATGSRSATPVRLPTSSTYHTTTGVHERLIDSGKGSSLLTGTSFDVLMNSLKSMREKDLDYLIHSSDDSLVRMTD